jgi:hypothetical protein
MEKWTNTNKQETDRQTNKKNSRFRNNRISIFKFWCYSSNIQYWCWYLSRISVVVLPGGWVLFFFLFCFVLFFQRQLLSQLLPSVRCSLSLGSEISSAAQQLSCFGIGFSLCWFTGGLFLCLSLFLWGKLSDLSANPCCVLWCSMFVFQFFGVNWLWMLLTGSGDELFGPLSALFQAAAYHLPAVSPSAFQPLFTESSWRSAPCSSPLLQCTRSTPSPLCCVLVFSSLFIQLFFFLQGRGQSVLGAMLVYPRGGWENTTWCLVLTCWSAECLPSRYGAGSWWHRQPTCSLSVTWHGEAFHVLGV